MTDPVAERILAQVATRLENITTADGYDFTVAGVNRASRFGGVSPTHLQVYVSMESLTPNDEISCQGNPPALGWEMVVKCALIATPNEDDEFAADAWRLHAYAAMSKAITTGVVWWQWDGLAINSMIGKPEMIINAEQGQVGAQTFVTIHFRTDENDPFTARA